MPVCPYCSQDITILYSSLRRDLIWHDAKWTVDTYYGEAATACSACYEELGPRDLDKLDVPNELRN